MTATLTAEEARSWLIEHGGNLRCELNNGRKRTIFYNAELGLFGMLKPGCRRNGTIIHDWSVFKRIFHPEARTRKEENALLIAKYKKHAARASFTNPWIRKIMAADPTKCPYENGITTGVPIEGKIITFKAIAKVEPYLERLFKEAFAARREWHSYRFPFRGYEASLWTGIYTDTGEPTGGLNLEYKGCANGYYYLLINDEEFIGHDID